MPLVIKQLPPRYDLPKQLQPLPTWKDSKTCKEQKHKLPRIQHQPNCRHLVDIDLKTKAFLEFQLLFISSHPEFTRISILATRTNSKISQSRVQDAKREELQPRASPAQGRQGSRNQKG